MTCPQCKGSKEIWVDHRYLAGCQIQIPCLTCNESGVVKREIDKRTKLKEGRG